MQQVEKIDIDAIKMWLDKGDIPRIAKEQNISVRQASNIIAGRNRGYKFITRLVEEAERNMALAKRTHELRRNLKLIQ